MEKDFKLIEEQIEILKNRNLLIKDEERAREIFKDNNYYYLINGYKDLFINKQEDEEKFKDNVSLEEIYSLYTFDSNLRIIFLKFILVIERKVDTYIAYEFSKTYGNKNYLVEDNFNNTDENNFRIRELITNINNDMMKQYNNGNKMICHYLNKHKYVPLWVLIRILSFGEVSKFYRLMKQKEENAISKNFNIDYRSMQTYLANLAIIRNVCAHDEKLYDIRMKYKIPNSIYHEQLEIKRVQGNYIKGVKDLFSIIIILKELLTKEEFARFYTLIVIEIEELSSVVSSININKILNKMGFPKKYKELLDLSEISIENLK